MPEVVDAVAPVADQPPVSAVDSAPGVIGAGAPNVGAGDAGRRGRLVRPVAVAAIGAALLGCLAFRDPNDAGAYPLCPFRALTGWDCPGCGSLRALHALTQGDVGRAADHNLLLLMVTPFLMLRFIRWVRGSWTGRPAERRLAPPLAIYALLALVVLFWVVRNLPGVPFLGAVAG